ncbi:MAG TPA: hypothetical protein VLA00_16420 [Xanthobacteraceae bacterium]|nr:hypothetical protein [Xanthobacteraceae bacterium]
MTWRLDPETWAALRDQTNLWLSDAESCAVVKAGAQGDVAAEFQHFVAASVGPNIAEALTRYGCPPAALDRAGSELLHAALSWRQERDARLSGGAKGLH